MQDPFESNSEDEFQSIKLLKFKYRRGGQYTSDFLQDRFTPEISSPLFNLRKLQDSEKSSPASGRIH